MIVAPLLASLALACPATPVHYEWTRLSPASPWIAAGAGSRGLVGQLLGTYEPTLGDRRVREAAGLTLHAGARHKIAWLPRRWQGTGRNLRIVAQRLGRPGRLTYRFRRAVAPQFFPSGITLPAAGCWRLSLASGTRRWTLHIRVVEPPAEPPCDANALQAGPNPLDPFWSTWVAATPGRARIYGAISVSLPGVPGAAIHTGGRKVLWLVDDPSGLLTITATRLDGPGSFEQAEHAAAGPVFAYPSRLDVPEPGCWLLRLRTSGRGGVVVMRAFAP